MSFHCLLTVLFLWAHPFYLSMTEIRYSPHNSVIEVAQRVFWDDLELALATKHRKKVSLLNPGDPGMLDKMIGDYVMEMTEIYVNGQKVPLIYLGYEIEEGTAWLHMSGKNGAPPRTVKIKNAMLIQQFDTQQNIINFYNGDNLKSTITYKDNEWGELRF